MDMMPFRARAWLRTGVVSDATLPLDGVLLYQAMRRKYGPQQATLPGTVVVQPEAADVPLKIVGLGQPDWFYACSFAQWPRDTAEGKAYWEKRVDTKRLDIVDLGRASRVVVEKGRYRSYHMPVFYRAALWVEWFGVGDIETIDALLRDVWAIGKKTSQGWGRIIRWEVAPWMADWSVMAGARLMRAVPEEGGVLWGIRPPYWRRENQVPCRMPSAQG
ncbi:MAG: hypothetical protein WC977_13330 [Anaerovoracaceae bacterium]|jgi:hypothetical protein